MKNTAKRFFMIICSVVALLCCFMLMASADTIESDGATYVIQTQGYYRYIVRQEAYLDVDKWMGSGAVIVEYTGTESVVTIPDTLGDEPVVAIFSEAFKENNFIESVSICQSVKYVGYKAFFTCESLKQVFIPKETEVIDDRAFDICSALKNVTFQRDSKLREIGEWAFANCKSLGNFIIPQGVESLGNGFLAYCDALTSIVIPDSVTSLGAAPFFHNDALTTVVIGNGVTSLLSYKDSYSQPNWSVDKFERGAFEGCINLTSVTIGTGVKEIGKECFAGTALTSVIIPDNVETIGEGAFISCAQLQKVVIGNGVIEIKHSAFWDCDELTDVSIGNSVITIGAYAFFDCDGLTTITVPDNVVNLGAGAFYHCSNLTSAVIGDGVAALVSFETIKRENWGISDLWHGTFEGCVKLSSVDLGASIYSIDIDTFAGTALTEITVPASVNTLNNGAFANVPNLSRIYFMGDWPLSVGDRIFEGLPIGFTIYYIDGNIGFYDLGYNTETFNTGHFHDFGKWYTVINPGCTNAGEQERACYCGYIESESIPALGHVEIKMKGVAATCTQAGYTAGKKCSTCGEILEYQKTIAPIGHVKIIIPGKAATCTETGLTEGVECAACGKILTEQSIIAKIDHVAVKIPAKAATCSEVGLTEGIECSICGKILKEQKAIPMLEHILGSWESIDNNSEIRMCTTCGKVIESRSINYLIGDINGDGKVTASDARIILRIATKLESADDYKNGEEIADVDRNDKITPTDARKALRIATKLETN